MARHTIVVTTLVWAATPTPGTARSAGHRLRVAVACAPCPSDSRWVHACRVSMTLRGVDAGEQVLHAVSVPDLLAAAATPVGLQTTARGDRRGARRLRSPARRTCPGEQSLANSQQPSRALTLAP